MIALFLIACGGGETPTPAPNPVEEGPAPSAEVSDVERALMIAKAIDADPSKADEAFSKLQITEEAYRELLYAIALDPAKAKAFAAGR